MTFRGFQTFFLFFLECNGIGGIGDRVGPVPGKKVQNQLRFLRPGEKILNLSEFSDKCRLGVYILLDSLLQGSFLIPQHRDTYIA